jgi:hypothetical protein
LFFALSLTSNAAAEPPTPPAKDKPAEKPADGLDGLGFSVAPREGGKARLQLFGAVGEGYKFVFVIDRSGSMGGDGRKALAAVKAELTHAIETLDSVHQFQIIFYNQRPAIFNPSGKPGRLAFATEENKRRAARFLETITAEGGTAHDEALRLAAQMQPDVIFLLTDADEPQLKPEQLARIRRQAAGIIIHAIEFGPGAQPAEGGFLAELARQNGGRHVYVDLSIPRPRERAKPKESKGE